MFAPQYNVCMKHDIKPTVQTELIKGVNPCGSVAKPLIVSSLGLLFLVSEAQSLEQTKGQCLIWIILRWVCYSDHRNPKEPRMMQLKGGTPRRNSSAEAETEEEWTGGMRRLETGDSCGSGGRAVFHLSEGWWFKSWPWQSTCRSILRPCHRCVNGWMQTCKSTLSGCQTRQVL